MKKIFNIITISLLFACSKDPREIAKLELQKEMEGTRLELERYKRSSISWSSQTYDKNECITKFLESISKDLASENCIIDPIEWKESYLPYVFGTGTLLDSTPLDKYLLITKQRQDIGIEKIKDIISNKNYKILSIQWTKNQKNTYGPFNGWKPVISLLVNRNTFVINEIKQVIEYNGTYRIAVIAP
jgi:hypothetical protein